MKHLFRNTIFAVLALCLILSLAACTGDDTEETLTDAADVTTTEAAETPTEAPETTKPAGGGETTKPAESTGGETTAEPSVDLGWTGRH